MITKFIKISSAVIILSVFVVAFTSCNSKENNEAKQQNNTNSQSINNQRNIQTNTQTSAATTNSQSSDKSKKIVDVQKSMPLFKKSDLILDSELIISGKVREVYDSKMEDPKNIYTVYTDISIDIDKIYKGVPYNKSNIIVRNEKGDTGEVRIESEMDPDFSVDERVILFLKKSKSNPNGNYYLLYAARQGKYILDPRDTTSDTYNMDYTKDLNYIRESENISLSKFDKEIKDEIEKEKKNPRKKPTEEEIRKNNEKLFGK